MITGTDNKNRITGGVYLVLDPSLDSNTLLSKLKEALDGGIRVVQIWDHWPEGMDKQALCVQITRVCADYGVPVLINEDYRLLAAVPTLHGIHFDRVPDSYEAIKISTGRPFLAGITCSGDMETVCWAEENRLDYISFCSMFPSSSAGSCTIVMPGEIRAARLQTNIPFFVSGGLTPDNIRQLKKAVRFEGVAVISGILGPENPAAQTKAFIDALNT